MRDAGQARSIWPLASHSLGHRLLVRTLSLPWSAVVGVCTQWREMYDFCACAKSLPDHSSHKLSLCFDWSSWRVPNHEYNYALMHSGIHTLPSGIRLLSESLISS